MGGRIMGPALMALLVLAAALALVWAATTGPVGVLGSPGSPILRHIVPPPSPTATDSGGGSAKAGPPSTKQYHRVANLHWLGELVQLAVLAAILFVLWRLARFVRDKYADRPRRDRIDADFEVLPDLEEAREQLLADYRRQLEALDRLSVRNGIVECWLTFESSAAHARAGRRPADTPTEFITRLLRRLDVDPRSAARLATLYEEARFSDHELSEDRRNDARAALDHIHADLAASGAAKGSW
ncbi:MAG: DUF4129 domain-containing protein [Actinomycetota bacterium]|nr:DUF4129 domain-containing protein [Actinomycetota bacterium]